MVPGCAHNGRAVHYAVTADYRPPILTVPRTGRHQAPRDWSSYNDGTRRRLRKCVIYRNFNPLLSLGPISGLVFIGAIRTRAQPHAPAGEEPNPTSEPQRNTQNTHCETGTPNEERQWSAAVCRATVGATGLCRIDRIHKNSRDIFFLQNLMAGPSLILLPLMEVESRNPTETTHQENVSAFFHFPFYLRFEIASAESEGTGAQARAFGGRNVWKVQGMQVPLRLCVPVPCTS